MFEQAFSNIAGIVRKEAGRTTELDYTEQTSWLLFLKYLYILALPCRWDTWAAPKTVSGKRDHNNGPTRRLSGRPAEAGRTALRWRLRLRRLLMRVLRLHTGR